MRIECDIAGLEANWVDVSDVWTRREFKALVGTDGGELIEMLHDKITACNIETADGAITDPAEITESSMDDMDLRLVGFIGSVLVTACMRLRELGNVSGRVSSSGTEKPPLSD